MKLTDMDTFSVKSSSSKSSKNPKTKKSRFSIRPTSLRIFRRQNSNSSTQVNRSSSEIETRSVRSISSVHTSHNSQVDRETSSDDHSNVEQSSADQLLECPVCLKLLPITEFPIITTCHHRSCTSCLRQYLKIEIMESRVNVSCPECAERFHPTDITSILNDHALMKKYEEFMIRRHLVTEPDVRWCPAPDCGYAVIATGCASCPKLRCEKPGCDTHFCYHCKQVWHPNQTCDAARAERTSNFRSPSISYSHESGSQKGDIKLCPQCGAFIIKMDDGSCNHMTCAVCGANFCWLCMKEITDLHYLSPSGCTYWGKKPWSRKKKKVPTATLR